MKKTVQKINYFCAQGSAITTGYSYYVETITADIRIFFPVYYVVNTNCITCFEIEMKYNATVNY